MAKPLIITVEQCERVGRQIEYSFEFVREILDDPTILDHIPSGATVHSIPKEKRDPDMHYDIETPRRLAIATPPDPALRSNAHPRHIGRGD